MESAAVLKIEDKALMKMLYLVASNEGEVGWHGLAEKDGDTYVLKDVIVYPQEVTQVTISPDQEEYQTWLMELPDYQFNRMRMQGHSHVNMSTDPSSTDIQFYMSVIEQMKTGFYIFMIVNKRLEHWVYIFNKDEDRYYRTDEITLVVSQEMTRFIQSMSNVHKKEGILSGCYNEQRDLYDSYDSFMYAGEYPDECDYDG